MTKTYTNEELIELFRDEHKKSKKELSKKTTELYVTNTKYLLNFLNNKSVFDITEEDILSYLESISSLARGTYNNRVFSYKSFFNVLRKSKRLKGFNIVNPITDIETYRNVESKVKDELSLVEQSILIKYTKDARERAIIIVLLKTALRISELIDIKLNDYLYRNEKNEILITGKGNKRRRVYFDKECVEAIDEYLKIRKDTSDRLFTSYGQNGVLDKCNLGRRIKNIAKRSGYFREERIKQMCNHLMRKTCASTMINTDKIPIESVQKLLGHTNINTTVIYAHTDEDTLRNYMDSRKNIAV